MPLTLSIVTPESDALEVSCDELVVPGANGELGLAPMHVPLISALEPGVLTTISGGKKTFYVVGTGFAEIDEDRVTILVSTFEAVGDIDVERAKKALAAAQSSLTSLNPDDPGYGKMQLKQRRAQARLNGVARIS